MGQRQISLHLFLQNTSRELIIVIIPQAANAHHRHTFTCKCSTHGLLVSLIHSTLTLQLRGRIVLCIWELSSFAYWKFRNLDSPTDVGKAEFLLKIRYKNQFYAATFSIYTTGNPGLLSLQLQYKVLHAGSMWSINTVLPCIFPDLKGFSFLTVMAVSLCLSSFFWVIGPSTMSYLKHAKNVDESANCTWRHIQSPSLTILESKMYGGQWRIGRYLRVSLRRNFQIGS